MLREKERLRCRKELREKRTEKTLLSPIMYYYELRSVLIGDPADEAYMMYIYVLSKNTRFIAYSLILNHLMSSHLYHSISMRRDILCKIKNDETPLYRKTRNNRCIIPLLTEFLERKHVVSFICNAASLSDHAAS